MLDSPRRAGESLNPLRLLSPGRILLVATLVVTGYLMVSAGNNVLHSYDLASDESKLRGEVQALERQKDQLLQIRDYLRTDEYIEFIARRVFGLVKPGETIVAVDSPPVVGVDGEEDGLTWWQRLFGR
jgi:cell division protein FtsB